MARKRERERERERDSVAATSAVAGMRERERENFRRISANWRERAEKEESGHGNRECRGIARIDIEIRIHFIFIRIIFNSASE